MSNLKEVQDRVLSNAFREFMPMAGFLRAHLYEKVIHKFCLDTNTIFITPDTKIHNGESIIRRKTKEEVDKIVIDIPKSTNSTNDLLSTKPKLVKYEQY